MAPINRKERRFGRVALTVGIVLTLAALILNAIVFPLVPVVVDVSSAQLYGDISGIDVGAKPRTMAFWLGVHEDSCYCKVFGIHSSTLYRCDRNELAADLPSFIERSRSAVGLPGVNGRWKEVIAHFDGGTERDVVDRFDEAHAAALVQDLAATKPEALKSLGEDTGMEFMRIQQAQFIWYQQVFEGVWLCVIIWLLLWPAIFRKRPRVWAVSFGIAPLLFILPVYLGYQSTITTTIGPTGGGLYTWLALHVPRASVGEIDDAIRMRIPQLLSGLSFHPGSVMAYSGRGLCGPLVTVIVGVIAGIVAWILAPRTQTDHVQDVAAPATK